MSDDEDALMDTPMTAKEMAVLVSAGTVRTTAIRMTPREWLRFGSFRIEADGSVNWTGSSGKALVTETNGATVAANTGYTYTALAYGSRPTVSIAANQDYRGQYSERRIGIKQITLAGGTAGDQELVAALAGYYGVMQLVYMISDTTDTYTFAFQDSDNAALTGLMGGSVNVSLTAQTINKTIEGAVLYKGTDNKALEVDVSGGAGAEVITIGYIYWYET